MVQVVESAVEVLFPQGLTSLLILSFSVYVLIVRFKKNFFYEILYLRFSITMDKHFLVKKIPILEVFPLLFE